MDEALDTFLRHTSKATKADAMWYKELLENAGYPTFVDEADIRIGDDIEEKMKHTLKRSRLVVVLFDSREFIQSWIQSWDCMEELRYTLKHKQGNVLPVFWSSWEEYPDTAEKMKELVKNLESWGKSWTYETVSELVNEVASMVCASMKTGESLDMNLSFLLFWRSLPVIPSM